MDVGVAATLLAILRRTDPGRDWCGPPRLVRAVLRAVRRPGDDLVPVGPPLPAHERSGR